MKFCFINRHKSMQKALEKAGYKVEEVVKQEKKTIITVSPAAKKAPLKKPRRSRG